jgi:hypothetical protein
LRAAEVRCALVRAIVTRALILGALTVGAIIAALTATVAPAGAGRPPGAQAKTCRGWGQPAIAADPRPHALRVFAIQFEQRPGAMASAADYERAVNCALQTEVVPHLARGRPNLVVFDEDVGLETIAIGSRGTSARALLVDRRYGCRTPLCPTLATLTAIDGGYARGLRYLQLRFPKLSGQLGRSFVAATDEFVRVFMTTMAAAARRYGIYVIASNTQAPFALTRDRAAVAALADPAGRGRARAVYAPTRGIAYDQTFVWGPHLVHRHDPVPLANLLADNYKAPLTTFEQELGFGSGPTGGAAARRNLRPIVIPGSGARLGIATSLPAFQYGTASAAHACEDVAVTYMRCLDRLGANVLIQADANDGQWTGADGNEPWQPLSWMGSAYRAVSDPSVHFAYAVNPFMVGNLADTPFDGQTAILQRDRRGRGCSYVGNRSFVPGQDLAAYRRYAGPKSQFLALAPWAAPDGSRSGLRRVGAALASLSGSDRYVQTAVIADLPFPADRSRRGCVQAGR